MAKKTKQQPGRSLPNHKRRKQRDEFMAEVKEKGSLRAWLIYFCQEQMKQYKVDLPSRDQIGDKEWDKRFTKQCKHDAFQQMFHFLKNNDIDKFTKEVIKRYGEYITGARNKFWEALAYPYKRVKEILWVYKQEVKRNG